ncbi:TetR/AcrR family transcriptional regulator [Actinoplanes sp. NPDC049265]|uniref:TetR/AcrR family transcriptional regulator n=1 Tax=Actinoplanes sp. NPDC049265 TaxID=3363902 RepID=UPI00371D41CD
MGYHHGDLRAALIGASFELLAEHGLHGFSVAAVARRLGVSSAAPYRHFPDRDHLLGAVSGVAAHDLRAAVIAAADAAGTDPVDRLAAVAGAYVRYVTRTGGGFHVIFAAGLSELPDEERREHTRALMTTLLELAVAVEPSSYPEVLNLIQEIIAVAHGYTTLLTDGFFTLHNGSAEHIAARAVRAAGDLANARR